MPQPSPMTKILIGLAAAGAVTITGLIIYQWHQRTQNRTTKLGRRKEKATANEKSTGDKDKVKPPLVNTGNRDIRTIEKEIKVCKQDLAFLIGKGGQTVKFIQRDTDTRILPKETLPNGDRLYKIIGVPEAVDHAIAKIENHLGSQPVLETCEIRVPESTLGRIIGRSGDNIRQIQNVSGAKIDIPRLEAITTVEDFEAPETNDGKRAIKITGTEEQQQMAIRLIEDTVEEELTQKKRYESARKRRSRESKNDNTANVVYETEDRYENRQELLETSADSEFDPLAKKTLSVFVSCVYQPNEFWFQVVGPDSIKLDKLSQDMTEYYRNTSLDEVSDYGIGDIVAAPYGVDGSMFRAKILDIGNTDVVVLYVDYGDKKTLRLDEIRKLNFDFLKLRFQAREATLNLPCSEEKWPDEIITELENLSCCAQWSPVTAKIISCIKDPIDSHEKLFVELYTKNPSKKNSVNIGEHLLTQLSKYQRTSISQDEDSTNANHPQDLSSSGDNANSNLIRRDSLVKNGISYATIASHSPN